MTAHPIDELIAAYDPGAPLDRAWTIPGPWYTDPRLFELERQTVFSRSWQLVSRAEEVGQPGQFVTAEVAGEPLLVARGRDGGLRAFFNVCRHHAARVATGPSGTAQSFRCPYHGWTYGLDGALRGTPDFDGVCGFDRAQNGLVPVAVDTWEGLVFVRLDAEGPTLPEFLGGLVDRVAPLRPASLGFFGRRSYVVESNWKVFVDNYLDGGYHVPFLHRGLDSVLDYAQYTIENFGRVCLQRSPMVAGPDAAVSSVRRGAEALYFWLYPNLMLNFYEGYLDTNLVLPLSVDRTLVVFDFYFADVSEAARERNEQSLAVGDRIQAEDLGICASVQKGLQSRAYRAGRLSVRREAGEHLFHRLLAADLRRNSPPAR